MLVAPGICAHAKGSMPAHGCPNWPEATGTSSSPGGWTPACAEKALRSSQPRAGQETTHIQWTNVCYVALEPYLYSAAYKDVLSLCLLCLWQTGRRHS